MEQVCEFCMVLRPAVYCQADCALLCLSCDSKVHSANALSNRHPRSVLCNSCQSRPASVRCEEHRTHMCRSCDKRLHGSGSNASQQQHQRHFIGSYTGCPSAQDFAALWELDLSSSQEFLNFGNTSLATSGQSGPLSSCMTSVCAGMSNSRTNNYRSHKIPQISKEKERQNQSSGFTLQQILSLERFHHSEGEESRFSRIMRGRVDKDGPSFSGKALRRSEEDMYENSRQSRDLEEELVETVSPLNELRSEGLLAPFSALEDTPSSSADMSPLADSFWQYRSPLQTSQFLSQNMPDIGVCEDLICHNDFNNIPDVDMTFRNFEELFGGDQDPNLGVLTRVNDLSCSSVDREVSVDESGHIQPHIVEDAGADSSSYVESDDLLNSDTTALKNHGQIQPSYSASSSSLSLDTERESVSQTPVDSETRGDAML